MLPTLWKATNGNWNPFRDLETISEEFNKMLNGGSFEPLARTPAVDIVDSKNHLRIMAELPGMDKKDIHVSVDGDVLTIKGEKHKEAETKEDGYVKSERYYGSFQRAIQLPSSIDTNDIKAAYKNGVLELTLNKREEAKPRQISIDVN